MGGNSENQSPSPQRSREEAVPPVTSLKRSWSWRRMHSVMRCKPSQQLRKMKVRARGSDAGHQRDTAKVGRCAVRHQ